MALEVGKARRARTHEEEFARIVFIAADASQAKALDLRLSDGQVQIKLECPDGNIGWFQMDPDDTLRVERRTKQRSTQADQEKDGSVRPKKSKSARLEPDSFRLFLSDGVERDVLELARIGQELRVTIADPENGKPIHRNLQVGEILTSISPKRELDLLKGSSSLGDSIRAQIIQSLTLQSLPEEGRLAPSRKEPLALPMASSLPNHQLDAPIYKTKQPTGRYHVYQPAKSPVTEKTFREELRSLSRKSLLGIILISIPIVASAWFLYDAVSYYSISDTSSEADLFDTYRGVDAIDFVAPDGLTPTTSTQNGNLSNSTHNTGRKPL